MTDAEIKKYSERILISLVRKYDVDQDTARDAMHSAFCSMRERGMDDIDQKAVQHYWYVCSRNELVNMLNQMNRYKFIDREWIWQHVGETVQPEPIEDTDKQIRKIYQRIMSLISKLDKRSSIAMTEKYIRNKTGRQIAALIGTSENHANVIMTRAKKKIKHLYNEKYIHDNDRADDGAAICRVRSN